MNAMVALIASSLASTPAPLVPTALPLVGVMPGLHPPDSGGVCSAGDVAWVGTPTEIPPPDATCIEVVDGEQGRFFLHREGAVTPVEFSSVDRAALTDGAQSHALTLLGALGLPQEQIGDVTTRAIIVEIGSTNTKVAVPPTKAIVGTMTWIGRNIRGVPVEGHKVVVALDLDGNLQHILARWPAIDADRSTWSLPSAGPCSAEMIPTWLDEVVRPGAIGEVQTTTTLLPADVPTEGGVVAVNLVVTAEALIAGPSGARKRQVFVCQEED